jgi:DNA polymerase III subunit gamma/tau
VLERMREQATRLGSATLTRYAEVVHAGLGEMRGATAPRLLLEVVCARLLLPSASDTEAALLQRVERIETRLDMSIPAAAPAPKQYTRKNKAEPAEAEPASEAPPSPPPVRPPSDPVVEALTSVPGEPNAAAVRSMWTTVREKVRQRSRTTEVMLAGATVRVVEGDTLVLSHESAPLAKRIVEQRNSDVIRDALKDALGVDWKIRCDVGGSQPAAAPHAPEAPPEPARDDEEESMLAEASNDTSEAPRRDPEEAALELLQNELGARRIDD